MTSVEDQLRAIVLKITPAVTRVTQGRENGEIRLQFRDGQLKEAWADLKL